MKAKLALFMILAVSLVALPLQAQHGHGGGGGGAAGVPHGPGMGSMGTAHSSDHPSNQANHDSRSGSGEQQSSVSQRITDDTKLASKLQSLLPAGTNLQQAA